MVKVIADIYLYDLGFFLILLGALVGLASLAGLIIPALINKAKSRKVRAMYQGTVEEDASDEAEMGLRNSSGSQLGTSSNVEAVECPATELLDGNMEDQSGDFSEDSETEALDL